MRLCALWLAWVMGCAMAHAQAPEPEQAPQEEAEEEPPEESAPEESAPDEGAPEQSAPEEGAAPEEEGYEPGQRGIESDIPEAQEQVYEPGQRGVDDDLPDEEPPQSPRQEWDYEDEPDTESLSLTAGEISLASDHRSLWPTIGLSASIGVLRLDPELRIDELDGTAVGSDLSLRLGVSSRYFHVALLGELGQYGWLTTHLGLQLGGRLHFGSWVLGLDLEGGYSDIFGATGNGASLGFSGGFVGMNLNTEVRLTSWWSIGAELDVRYLRMRRAALECDPAECGVFSAGASRNGLGVRFGLRLQLHLF